LARVFDRVPRELIIWAVHKLGVDKWLVSAVMSVYLGARTLVRTVHGNSDNFEVKVGMHQGSALSTLLFVIVMEAISREFEMPCHGSCYMQIILVVIAGSEEELIKKLNR